MNITMLLIDIIVVSIWLGLLISDNYLYYKSIEKKKKIEKLKKEKEKRDNINLRKDNYPFE